MAREIIFTVDMPGSFRINRVMKREAEQILIDLKQVGEDADALERFLAQGGAIPMEQQERLSFKERRLHAEFSGVMALLRAMIGNHNADLFLANMVTKHGRVIS